MQKKSQTEWPEIIVSNSSTTAKIYRAVEHGQLRKIASRLYTSNFKSSMEEIINRNRWEIIAGFFPKALIADRTALEMRPAEDHSICIITKKGRDVELPGLRIRVRRGVGPLEGDKPYLHGLYLCSTPRAYLENMKPSRAIGDKLPRTLPQSELERRLDQFIRTRSLEELNRMRDRIQNLASDLNLTKEAQKLDEIIGALQGTREAELKHPLGKARQAGRPFDPDRIDLFETLMLELRNTAPTVRLLGDLPPTAYVTLCFFESYFSNYIEGTRFEISEASEIVFKGAIPKNRPKDAHDIFGTWKVISNKEEYARVPENFDSFLELLKKRHFMIMEGRPEIGPGKFKIASNQAGSTIFVLPELVIGTLEKGFEVYQALDCPLHKAIFMMYLVSEVHPFSDGNGRIARIMMNAELASVNEHRIMIPTIFRNNYLSALKALSNTQRPGPLIVCLDFAQRWTRAIKWSGLEETIEELNACHAFDDANEAENEGRRLLIPTGA